MRYSLVAVRNNGLRFQLKGLQAESQMEWSPFLFAMGRASDTR